MYKNLLKKIRLLEESSQEDSTLLWKNLLAFHFCKSFQK